MDLGKSALWKFFGHAMGTWFVVVMLPGIFLGHLIELVGSHLEVGSLLEIIWGYSIVVLLYFSGVYATYRHVQWREKNMSHILKPKQDKDSSEQAQIVAEEE